MTMVNHCQKEEKKTQIRDQFSTQFEKLVPITVTGRGKISELSTAGTSDF